MRIAALVVWLCFVTGGQCSGGGSLALAQNTEAENAQPVLKKSPGSWVVNKVFGFPFRSAKAGARELRGYTDGLPDPATSNVPPQVPYSGQAPSLQQTLPYYRPPYQSQPTQRNDGYSSSQEPYYPGAPNSYPYAQPPAVTFPYSSTQPNPSIPSELPRQSLWGEQGRTESPSSGAKPESPQIPSPGTVLPFTHEKPRKVTEPAVEQADIVVYNTKTYKYHKPTCPWAVCCTANCSNLPRSEVRLLGAIPCSYCGGGELVPLSSGTTSQPSSARSQTLSRQSLSPQLPVTRAPPRQAAKSQKTSKDQETVVFNVKSYKFHYPSCSAAIRCTRNCIETTRGDAHQRGGIPCQLCGGGE